MKLFGLNLVAVIAATIAFFVVGALWYGFIFTDAWMAAEGVTKEDAGSPLWMIGGFVLTLVVVVGIGLVMKWRNVSGLSAAAMTGAVLWVLFALPLMAYDYIYLPSHSLTLLMIDGGHLLVGWVLSAVVLSALKV